MAPNRGRNRAAEFEDLIEKGPTDFDPEADDIANRSSDDEGASAESGDEHDGREHYAPVAKSKLRKAQQVALGPQYRGSKIRRQALDDDEDEDDPFGRGFDEEESVEEGSDMEDIGDSDEDEELSEDDEEEEDLTDATSDDGSSGPGPAARTTARDKEAQDQLRQIVSGESRKAITASLSQANREEAEKGKSVKQQRATFDSLLSSRMKLQKSLIATNTMVATVGASADSTDDKDDIFSAVEAAELAAFTLWNSLNDLRHSLSAAQNGKKRKRPAFTVDSSTDALWLHMQEQEEESKPKRHAVLEKWSKRTQGPTVIPDRGRLNQDRQATIVDVLQEQLSNMDRLVKKTQAPRSCAPLQSSQRIAEDEKIYDDADFYGLLLKELLEQKSHDSVAVSNIDIGFQMRRDNKTKRNVDTKASKGRKLRYTVQEKLQNFMAPENRATWPERQADELFGSLFGQRMQLQEKDHESEASEDEVDPAEAGLLMFKN